MPTPVAWPVSVRTKTLQESYTPLPPKALTESSMERGHKLRRSATGTPEEHKIRLRLPTAEFADLETWFEQTNPVGSLEFYFPHPRTRQMRRCQIIPQDKRPYLPSKAPGQNWYIDMTLRIYPGAVT